VVFYDNTKKMNQMKVYVIYDPLYEKIVCVHDKPDMDCCICIKAQERHKKEFDVDLYPLEEQEFEIQSGNKLIPIKLKDTFK